jgi:ferredoxin
MEAGDYVGNVISLKYRGKVIMGERPRYTGIFDHIQHKYCMDDNQPDGSVKYRELIKAEQYDHREPPVSRESRDMGTPGEAASWVKDLARELHADLVGITRVNPDWIFEGGSVEGEFAIVMAVRMDFREIMAAPDLRAGVETTRAYYALGSIVIELSRRLREVGYASWAQHPRFSASRTHGMLYLPHAVAAGLGRLGRNGLVITPEFGPCARFAAVTTDLDLEVDRPLPQDVLEYCQGCTECREACDGDAIPHEPSVVRGVRKYAIDPYACAPHFAKWDGCSKCISACPPMISYVEELQDERPWTPAQGDGAPLP